MLEVKLYFKQEFYREFICSKDEHLKDCHLNVFSNIQLAKVSKLDSAVITITNQQKLLSLQ
ncbi:MAG: hypothetical protein RMJ37_02855 [Spirochaetia bacterium]|nr:hypothetical protein [Spirochaetota bacterium]MDW8112266.1 hypothetical protein [Spirochaetia bacterium]